MSTLLAPRPFSTLGVIPFLYADDSQKALIQNEYFKKIRTYHPDLISSQSLQSRNMQEASSARLNFDYAILKDFWKLLESIVHGAKFPQSAQGSVLPPDLATEYFELQDLWQEKGAQDPLSLSSQEKFLKKIESELSGAEKFIMGFAKRFPFSGFGNAAAPWTEKDLVELSTHLQKLRYLKSVLKDVKNKMKETENS